MYWKDIPVYIIDFEGTRKSGILEYGVVALESGNICDTYTSLCASQGPISAFEFQEHGIAEADIAGAASFNEQLELFAKFRKTGAFGAHHASVEEGLLKHYWPYAPPSVDFLNVDSLINEWGPWIDTCQLYRNLYSLESYSLMDLIDVFCLKGRLGAIAQEFCPKLRMRAHCALYDALASAILLQYLGEQPGFEQMSIQWLFAHSAPEGKKRGGFQQKELFR